jgi:16S rRNA (guanine(966)-N(2))-methyltransferase RsmD
MGLEALSRGAAHCTFFERDRAAVSVIRKNLTTLDAHASGMIISRDAWRDVAAIKGERSPELIFLDPPYDEARDVSRHGNVWQFLDRMRERTHSGRLVVLHHPKTVDFAGIDVETWRVLDRRTIGSNGLTVFQQ